MNKYEPIFCLKKIQNQPVSEDFQEQSLSISDTNTDTSSDSISISRTSKNEAYNFYGFVEDLLQNSQESQNFGKFSTDIVMDTHEPRIAECFHAEDITNLQTDNEIRAKCSDMYCGLHSKSLAPIFQNGYKNHICESDEDMEIRHWSWRFWPEIPTEKVIPRDLWTKPYCLGLYGKAVNKCSSEWRDEFADFKDFHHLLVGIDMTAIPFGNCLKNFCLFHVSNCKFL